jgi:hypothetical protein
MSIIYRQLLIGYLKLKGLAEYLQALLIIKQKERQTKNV